MCHQYQYPKYYTLREALENISEIDQDKYGRYIFLVEAIGLKKIVTPIALGEYILDDVKRLERHLFKIKLVKNAFRI